MAVVVVVAVGGVGGEGGVGAAAVAIFKSCVFSQFYISIQDDRQV